MRYSCEFIQMWINKPLLEQEANIGSEVHRSISWRLRNNPQYSKTAFDISLELIDLTLKSNLSQLQRNEILRLKKSWSDFYLLKDSGKLTNEYWEEFFYRITYTYAIRKGK